MGVAHPASAGASADVGDADLIVRVRAGSLESYGDLFARHRDAAVRLARALGAGADADDVVADAFARVLDVMRRGGGPEAAFRPYLLTAVRRCHVDRIRAQRRNCPVDDLSTLQPFPLGGAPSPVGDTAGDASDRLVAGFEAGAAARAFASLPERWQLVLWHLDVEGEKPAQVAPLLGMTPNSVSALAYRAREGLRQAFVQMHSQTADAAPPASCRESQDRLGAYVRGGLSRRDTTRVREHLHGCRRCTAIYLELAQVNSALAHVLGPVVLGGACAAYLGSGAHAAGIALTGATIGRAVRSHEKAVAATAVAAAGVVVGAGLLWWHPSPARPHGATAQQPTAGPAGSVSAPDRPPRPLPHGRLPARHRAPRSASAESPAANAVPAAAPTSTTTLVDAVGPGHSGAPSPAAPADHHAPPPAQPPVQHPPRSSGPTVSVRASASPAGVGVQVRARGADRSLAVDLAMGPDGPHVRVR